MDASDTSSLSSDWDIVNSVSLDSEETIEEASNETATTFEWEKTKECQPTGSGVDDIIDDDISNQNDSNSSSDIDVIEETAEDLIKMSIPSMEYSINSSISVDSSDPAPVPVLVERGWGILVFLHRLFRNPHAKDYLVVAVISILMTFSVHLQGTPGDKVKEMEEQVEELRKENSNLRNHMISSKIEDDKLLFILEEQIKAIRLENQKLSSFMQSLISHMEEQTTILKEENEIKEKDPYKEEIDKLKEQVNFLQTDNDDLQQQLVRMRYGAYAQSSENEGKDATKEKEKTDKEDSLHEKIFDTLAENMENLKERLYSEVGDLKEWKESVYNLIKQLNHKKDQDEEKGSHENEKPVDEDRPRRQTKEDSHKKTNDNEDDYEWSWEGMKKNLRHTFDNINVSDMFSKYASLDKKKVKGYFESMSHYFKKAQEKTKNILNSEDKDKHKVWSFLGDLQRKWADMKREYFKGSHKNGPLTPDREGEGQDSDSGRSHRNEENPRRTARHFKTAHDEAGLPREESNGQFNNMFSDPEWMFKFNSILERKLGPDWRAEMERLYAEAKLDEMKTARSQGAEYTKNAEGSWLFNRAASRNSFRQHDVQEDSTTNWFLRKKKTAKGDFDRHP